MRTIDDNTATRHLSDTSPSIYVHLLTGPATPLQTGKPTAIADMHRTPGQLFKGWGDMLKYAKIGALDVAYDEIGNGERPFVMVHGFTGSRDDFADTLESISTLGRTLVPDLRGHGGTTNPGEGYSLDRLSDDLVDFLDVTGTENCDLLGHSLGGMIALRLVLAKPERVASLVLMDTAARSHASLSDPALGGIKWISRRIPMRWQWRALRANRRRSPEPARRAAEAMGPERYWDRIREKLEAMDPVAFDELLRAIVRQQSVSGRLHEIHCPTLVMVGDQDTAFLESSLELADGIPDAKLIIIEDAHHSPQIEAFDAWFAAIQTHLERVRA